MQAARAMTGHALESILPGIGIVSDITLMWDGVSIGATSFSRYETLCVTGGNFVDYQTGALRPRLLAAPSLSLKHGGRGQVDLLRRELKSMHLGTAALRSRLVVLGADGAGTRGGEDARHQSTGAAEILWEAVFPGGDPQEMWTACRAACDLSNPSGDRGFRHSPCHGDALWHWRRPCYLSWMRCSVRPLVAEGARPRWHTEVCRFGTLRRELAAESPWVRRRNACTDGTDPARREPRHPTGRPLA